MSDKILEKRNSRLERINEELETQIEELSRDNYNQYKEIQEVYDVLNYSIIIISDQGEILRHNRHAADHLLIEEDTDFFSIVKDEKTISNIKGLIDSKESSEKDFQTKLLRRSGETLPFISSLTVLDGHSGKKFVFTANEITNLKKEELKRSELQRQLMQQSFKEGMAESAISILHNIGNVLTGMIGSIDTSYDQEAAKIPSNNYQNFLENIKKLESENNLINFLSDDSKRKQLISFMEKNSSEFDKTLASFDDLLNNIKSKAHHIGSIISVQQQYADLKKGIKTSLTLDSVLEDCFLINESKLAKDYIEIKNNIEKDISFSIEKNGFIQVLSNILVNSIESIETKINSIEDYTKGIITIESRTTDKELIVSFKDDAMGFDKSIAEKIYKFGFSTKERSSGFGLHNCQNFMNNQGGKFEISSEGSLKGALVTLYIPLSNESK